MNVYSIDVGRVGGVGEFEVLNWSVRGFGQFVFRVEVGQISDTFAVPVR